MRQKAAPVLDGLSNSHKAHYVVAVGRLWGDAAAAMKNGCMYICRHTNAVKQPDFGTAVPKRKQTSQLGVDIQMPRTAEGCGRTLRRDGAMQHTTRANDSVIECNN